MKPSCVALREEVLANGGDILKAARMLGMNPSAAHQHISDTIEDQGDVGKPSLRRFIIATRRVDRGWSPFQQDILDKARKKYDAGTHEMCQGRCGNILIQYLIPRLYVTKPRSTFAYDPRMI